MNGRSANFSRSQRAALPIAILGCVLLAGCGAPGEPTAPSPPVPTPISDLAAHQQGSGVQLVFTPPARTVAGDRLGERPAIEIFRGSLKSNGSPDDKSFKLVYTIPGALTESYSLQGKIQFTDLLPPDDLRANPSATYTYRVRTRASKKKASADSNTVLAKVFPVADKIVAIEVRVTQAAIEISWPAPIIASNANETLGGYHVYRGELDPASPVPASGDLSQAKWKSAAVLLAPTQTNAYGDTLFEFGKTYVYQVRSMVIADGNAIESDDSTPAIITPRDTFPPAPPQNVVAAEIPATDSAIAVELSWSINLENDLAGYRVYRSDQQGERGKLLNAELLLSPAYRDISVQAALQYWYAVTAVDRTGNESEPSEAVLADLTRPLP